MCQSLLLEEISAVGAGYAKHSKVCGDNQLGQRKECMSLPPSLSAWSWRWACIARSGNKIISLSDGPPLGLAHSRFPIEFIFCGIQGGGGWGPVGRRQRKANARGCGKGRDAASIHLPQVRCEARAGPHLLAGILQGYGPAFWKVGWRDWRSG